MMYGVVQQVYSVVSPDSVRNISILLSEKYHFTGTFSVSAVSMLATKAGMLFPEMVVPAYRYFVGSDVDRLYCVYVNKITSQSFVWHRYIKTKSKIHAIYSSSSCFVFLHPPGINFSRQLPWGPATAHGVGLLTEMYAMYMWSGVTKRFYLLKVVNSYQTLTKGLMKYI